MTTTVPTIPDSKDAVSTPSKIPASLPNIVFFITDDHGQRDSTPYGATDVRTPNMERLAREGMTFDNAFVVSPTCAPSRAALLTGMMPIKNGAMDNHTRPRPDIKKLPAYLKENGYAVVAIGKVSHYQYTGDYGFDYYAHDTFHDDEAVPAALRWLRERGASEKPLALFVGTNWPHVPWPSEEEGYDPDQIELPPTLVDIPATREARAGYYAAISRMDAELGQVYDTARECLGENLLFMTTNDHGAQFPFGKWNLYDAGIRTPLIAVWAGVIASGSRTSAKVTNVDILPTLNEVAGGEHDPEWDGRSFFGVLRGEETEHRDRIFATHSRDLNWNIYPCRAVRTDRWKYIRNLMPEARFTTHIDKDDPLSPRYWTAWEEEAKINPAAAAIVERYHKRPAEELYDLEADPFERDNLVADPVHASTREKLRAELDIWMGSSGDLGLRSESVTR